MSKNDATKTMSTLNHEVEVVSVGPKKAKEFLDGTFERNRPIVQTAVDYYVKQMTEQSFLNATPIIFALVEPASGEGNTRLVLVDGQHRLSAIVASKKHMQFVMQTYYLYSERQLTTLYSTIDIGRARNLNDNVRAHGMPEETGLTQGEANALASAIPYVMQKKPAFQVKSKDFGNFVDQIDSAKEYLPEAQTYFAITKKAPAFIKSIAMRKSIIATALITLRGQPNKAEDFWRGAILLDNISQNDVRHKLHHKLLEVVAPHGGPYRSQSQQNLITNIGLARVVCTCWNAYSSNRLLRVIKPIKTLVFNRCKWREEK